MRSTFINTVFCIISVCLIYQFAHGYEETFEKNPKDWNPVKGTKWDIKDGAYHQSNIARNQYSFYAVDDHGWQDYVFEVQVNPVSPNNYAGVLWRVQEMGDGGKAWTSGKFYYWLIGINGHGGNYSKIWEANGGAGAAVDQNAGTEILKKGKWNDIRLEVNRDTFKMYLNGKLQKEYTDQSDLLQWGGIGLATYDAESLFDNVKVIGKGGPGGLAVNSQDKLAVKWSKLKRSNL